MSNTQPINENSKPITNSRQSDRDKHPVGSPKANKDFKKVLGDPTDEEQNAEEFAIEAEEDDSTGTSDKSIAQGRAVTPPSLFTLASTKKPNPPKPADSPMNMFNKPVVSKQKLPDEPLLSEVAEDESEDSSDSSDSSELSVTNRDSKSYDAATDALGAITSRERQSDGKSGEKSMDRDQEKESNSDSDRKSLDSVASSHKGPEKTTTYQVDQQNSSFVNALTAAHQESNISIANAENSKASVSTTNLQSLINQLVESAYEMKAHDMTETTIVLKQPPLFAGASIVMTSFDSARGEFNLTFQNLTQGAKDLLDMRANQESLKSALEQKGYAVHIVITTTEIEKPVIAEGSQSSNNRQDQGQKNKDEGQPRKRQQ